MGIWNYLPISKIAGVTFPICGNNGKWDFPLLPQIGTVITILGEMYSAVTSQENTIRTNSLRRHFNGLSQTRTTFAFTLTLLLNHCFLSDSDTHFNIPIISVKLYTDFCFTFARASWTRKVAMLEWRSSSCRFTSGLRTWPLCRASNLYCWPGDSKLHTVRIIRDTLQIYWTERAL